VLEDLLVACGDLGGGVLVLQAIEHSAEVGFGQRDRVLRGGDIVHAT
jgi:hypothetical protein